MWLLPFQKFLAHDFRCQIQAQSKKPSYTSQFASLGTIQRARSWKPFLSWIWGSLLAPKFLHGLRLGIWTYANLICSWLRINFRWCQPQKDEWRLVHVSCFVSIMPFSFLRSGKGYPWPATNAPGLPILIRRLIISEMPLSINQMTLEWSLWDGYSAPENKSIFLLISLSLNLMRCGMTWLHMIFVKKNYNECAEITCSDEYCVIPSWHHKSHEWHCTSIIQISHEYP